MIFASEGRSQWLSRVGIALSLLVLMATVSREGLAKDAVHFSRVGSTGSESIVHFAANKPALAALQREMDAPTSKEPARSASESPQSVLKARGSGKRAVDGALAQLLRGFATLEGELARVPQAGARYRVQPGDTLDDIIFRTLGDLSVRHEVVRDAFIRANPRAFRRKNPNYLFAGVELRIPGAEDFRAVVFDDPKVGQTIDRRRMIRYP